MHVANVVQRLIHHSQHSKLEKKEAEILAPPEPDTFSLAITMDNLECIVIWIRIRTDNRRENWSRMPMNDGLDT